MSSAERLRKLFFELPAPRQSRSTCQANGSSNLFHAVHEARNATDEAMRMCAIESLIEALRNKLENEYALPPADLDWAVQMLFDNEADLIESPAEFADLLDRMENLIRKLGWDRWRIFKVVSGDDGPIIVLNSK